MSTRTLRPRDLDPRTLRVVRQQLVQLSESLRREADDWRRQYRLGKDAPYLSKADYTSGLLSAVYEVDGMTRDIAKAEKVMRARMKRRTR